MYLLFSVLMEGRPVSHSGVVSDLSDSHVEILRTLIMLDIPVWEYQVYLCAAEADLEDVGSLLSVKVVGGDESS